MTETLNDYERWGETEAVRLIDTYRGEIDAVRELLIHSCHSSPLAERFFKERLGSEQLLGVLLGLAVEDYSGDAQMTASYWVSQFPPSMLAPHAAALAVVAANEWDSVAIHAQRALEAVAQQTHPIPTTPH